MDTTTPDVASRWNGIELPSTSSSIGFLSVVEAKRLHEKLLPAFENAVNIGDLNYISAVERVVDILNLSIDTNMPLCLILSG